MRVHNNATTIVVRRPAAVVAAAPFIDHVMITRTLCETRETTSTLFSAFGMTNHETLRVISRQGCVKYTNAANEAYTTTSKPAAAFAARGDVQATTMNFCASSTVR